MCFNAGAETVQRVEGNMSGSVMRGPVALPGSETSSRTKGTRRNLGDLISPTAAQAAAGHDGKSRRRSRRGRGEESDDCIVLGKPRTKPISRIGGGDGGGKASSDARTGHRAGSCVNPKLRAYGSKHAWAAQAPTFDRARPPAGAQCGKAVRWDLSGGTGATRPPTATSFFVSIGTVCVLPFRYKIRIPLIFLEKCP